MEYDKWYSKEGLINSCNMPTPWRSLPHHRTSRRHSRHQPSWPGPSRRWCPCCSCSPPCRRGRSAPWDPCHWRGARRPFSQMFLVTYSSVSFGKLPWHLPATLFEALPQLTRPPLHYAARAMGAMTLRISKLCLSFSPHPLGNFNLVYHFICVQIFQINEKGTSWAVKRWPVIFQEE